MIRVLVADDHAVLRAGAKEIVLRGFQDAICGEAANGEQVLEQVKKQKWDLVILDITMPGRSGPKTSTASACCGRVLPAS